MNAATALGTLGELLTQPGHWLWQPFADYAFMRHALVGGCALALGCVPVGALLLLRRLSLIGDALSHALLPGAAIAFILYGTSLWAMTVGSLFAALGVVMLAGVISRLTRLREDANFAALYQIALALGVVLVTYARSRVDLLGLLFGNVLAVDMQTLRFIATVSSASLLLCALCYRRLVLECVDPDFLRAAGGRPWGYFLFLMLLALNLVAGFQSMGSLMVVGLMTLPAGSARLWTHNLPAAMVLAAAIGLGAVYLGLLFSYHANQPAGPAIVLTAGIAYGFSLLCGQEGGLMGYWIKRGHLER